MNVLHEQNALAIRRRQRFADSDARLEFAPSGYNRAE
jgi:hypothetical protein